MPPPPVTVRPLSVWNSFCLLGCAVVAAERELRGVERLLDGAAAGRVVERRGQRQARVLRQRKDALHQALAEARLADDGGAVVILQRAGDDLGRAGALAVDQDRERETCRAWRSSGTISVFSGDVPAADGHHLRARRQKQRERLERRGEQPAGIVAEVEHQARQAARRRASRWPP